MKKNKKMNVLLSVAFAGVLLGGCAAFNTEIASAYCDSPQVTAADLQERAQEKAAGQNSEHIQVATAKCTSRSTPNYDIFPTNFNSPALFR